MVYDAEHFFDGYRADPDYALAAIGAASRAGADWIVLCDTNGGSLPDYVERVMADVAARTSARIGVHFHNDGACAVANSLVAVRAGASQVQGCVNGYGERVGNADLSAVVPNLSLKMGVQTIAPDCLERLTPAAHHIAELVNITPNPQQPYVGTSAFAHKAGLHVSAIARRSDAYEHVPPDAVGNGSRFVVSELAGRSTLTIKAAELGLDLDDVALGDVLDTLKRLEHQGYHFEAADGSLELLMRQATGWAQSFFEVESFRVITEHRVDQLGPRGGAAPPGPDGAVELGPSSFEGLTTEATVKIHVTGERIVATAEGNGPVHALDAALRMAIGPRLPGVGQLHLTDYRVRVLEGSQTTGAVTRVLIDSTDGERTWSTIGVSENIIEASWQALVDSIVYGLLHQSA